MGCSQRLHWIELALAHVERDAVRGAYNSALYLTPRRRMLQDWADAIEGMIAGEDSAVPSKDATRGSAVSEPTLQVR